LQLGHDSHPQPYLTWSDQNPCQKTRRTTTHHDV
jgi:hypothetical protein